MKVDKKDLKIGIFTYFGYYLNLKERTEHIKKAGFDSTMLWWGKETFEGRKKEEVMDLINEIGLEVENIHVPYENANDLWSEDDNVRKAIVDKYIEWISDCHNYRIPIMVMHTTKGYFDDINESGLESLREIVKVAESLGVIVAIENTRVDKATGYLLSNIDSKSLGLCFDSSHAQLYSYNTTDMIDKFGDRIVALHLSDNDGKADRHWLPGEGIIDWDNVMAKFKENGFSGNISLEIFPENVDKYDRPSEFLKKAYEKGLELKRMLE